MKCIFCGNEVTQENISTCDLPYLCWKCESEKIEQPIWEAWDTDNMHCVHEVKP